MNPSSRCTSCGTDLDTSDRFCPSCGREANLPVFPGQPKTCPLCGQANQAAASTCTSCGARIGETAGAVPPPRQVTAGEQAGPSFFQSWKFTAGIGALLIVGLIIFVSAQGGPEKVSVKEDPHDAEMIKEIKDLQSRIDADPEDRVAMLQLANRLYDVQFFDRAAVMYENYLKVEPGNLDARVDLGTSYFQMSFTDSVRHEAYQQMAEKAFLEAIRLNPSHQLANFNLGIIHLHKGDMAGARKWFEKCISIDPGSEAARRAKELLSQHVQNTPS
jgi:tetratricopeptide (TPR) repeat protein